jgi:hypothetical protein
LFVDKQTAWQVELARPTTFLAPCHQQPPGFIKDLNVLELIVEDVQMPLAVDRDVARERKIAGGIALSAERTLRSALAIKDLHAKVHRIRNDQPALFTEGQTGREIERTRFDATLTDAPNLAPLFIESDQRVLRGIKDPQFPRRRAIGQRDRPLKDTISY